MNLKFWKSGNMKFIGIIIINLVFTASGLIAAYSLKEKEIICRELSLMARTIKTELSFSSASYSEIIKRMKNEKILSHLSFICTLNYEAPDIITPLSAEENERINYIFRQLGSVDTASMLDELTAFEGYFNERRELHSEQVKSRSKLYIASGMLSGAAVTVMLL